MIVRRERLWPEAGDAPDQEAGVGPLSEETLAHQQQLLLEEHQRLHEISQKLQAERENLQRQLLVQQQSWLEQSKHLEEQKAQLERARAAFREEQAQARQYWQKRWDDEWQRLADQARLVELQRKQVDYLRRQNQQQLEQGLAHLEEQRRQFEREKAAWLELKGRQEKELHQLRAELDARARSLAAIESQFQQRHAQLVTAIQEARTELQRLQSRTAAHRRKLAELQSDVAVAEQRLGMQALGAESPAFSTPGADSETHTHTPAPAVHTSAASEGVSVSPGPSQLLEQAEKLEDLCRALLELKDAWQWEWDRSWVEVRLREEQIRQKEQALAARGCELERSQQALAQWQARLDERERACTAKEIRLEMHMGRWSERRRQWLGRLRARLAQARAVQKQFATLIAQHAEEWAQEHRRLADAWAQALRMHNVAQNVRDQCRRELDRLAVCHRELVERHMALDQMHVRLALSAPDPVQMERELRRRLRHWAKIALAPLRSVEQREQQIELDARLIVHWREQLQLREAELERLRTQCVHERNQIAALQAAWSAQLARLQQRADAWQRERSSLIGRIQDLEAQVDRLALLLTQDDPPPPALSLAA